MGYSRQTITLILLIIVVAGTMLPFPPSVAADESTLSTEQIEQFLLTAQVVGSRPSKKGITRPDRLTLSDGKITHDAFFETVDERRQQQQLGTGIELNFVDSYKYNIAAYRLAKMLGLDDLVPVYVERNYRGKTGSLSWMVPAQMDTADRIQKRISPPDHDAWNKQMYKVRVLNQLVYDTDANLTNVLITPEWKLWRIDFSRAFRLYRDLLEPKDLVRCDRQLLFRLKTLNGNELAAKTKGYLTNSEVKAVMARRDKIIAHFQKLIAEKGEDAVLY